MRNAGLDEAWAGIKIAEINTSHRQMTPNLWQKVKKNWRASWWGWKRRVKSWLKTQPSKNKDHGNWSHHFMANQWGNSGSSDRFYFLGLQNHCGWWLQPQIKTFTPWKKSYDNLHSILKSRDITLTTKVCLVKGMVFPVAMYGCESWAIKKTELQRVDAFEPGC